MYELPGTLYQYINIFTYYMKTPGESLFCCQQKEVLFRYIDTLYKLI